MQQKELRHPGLGLISMEGKKSFRLLYPRYLRYEECVGGVGIAWSECVPIRKSECHGPPYHSA